MKKLFKVLFIVLILSLFNSNVYAKVYKDKGLTDEQIESWFESAKDTNYNSICIYKYEYDPGKKGKGKVTDPYYIFALLVSETSEENYSLIGDTGVIVPLRSNSDMTYKFAGENKINKVKFNSSNPFDSTPLINLGLYSDIDTNDFVSGCPTNIDFSKTRAKNSGAVDEVSVDSVYKLVYEKSDEEKWGGDLTLLYEYSNSSRSTDDSIVCKYGKKETNKIYLNVSYSTLSQNATYELTDDFGNDALGGSGLGIRSKIGKDYLIYEINDTAICPQLFCSLDFTTNQFVVDSYSDENSGKTNYCELLEAGSSEGNVSTVDDDHFNVFDFSFPVISFGNLGEICSDVSGESTISLIKMAKNAVMIVSVVVAIVYSMILFFPVIINDDKDGLSNALKKFVLVIILLVVILLLPTLVKFIGGLAGLDLSCL